VATNSTLPFAERDVAHLPGHWLLARLGKRVLRPGGARLTTALLADAGLPGADVVELAPGLGRTAGEIVAAHPASYTGVEQDPAAAGLTRDVVGGSGSVVTAVATSTGLADHSCDVVVGEAMLTMQTDRGKSEIIAEARRVLRDGGRYAVHELALTPDDLPDETKTEIRHALARTIKVNARPLTVAEWRSLFEDAGFSVRTTRTAPMALLQTRRMLADEGLVGTLRITGNVLRDKDALRRVLDMRATFRRYRRSMVAVALVAERRPA
jgi:SAM-dependent methyltransferase